MTQTINIERDFSRSPGGRFIQDGSFSGEEFRENFLIPALEKAISSNDILNIELDGDLGYGSSFLEESFGGLIRKNYKLDVVLNHLKIQAKEPRFLVSKKNIEYYLQNADKYNK